MPNEAVTVGGTEPTAPGPRSDLTVVVQGPLSPVAVAHCEAYLRQARRVVFSFWEGNDLSVLEPLRALAKPFVIRKVALQPSPSDPASLEIVPADDPEPKGAEPGELVFVQTGGLPLLERQVNNGRCVNLGNIYRQCVSTLAGLSFVDTRFVIKTRADEGNPDLGEVTARLHARPSVVITNNVVAVKDRVRPFQPSDHLIAGTTANLKAMFETAKRRCETADTMLAGGPNPAAFLETVRRKSEQFYRYFSAGGLGVEQILATSLLRALGREVRVADSRQLMTEHFDILPLHAFGNWTLGISARFAEPDVLESFRASGSFPPGVQLIGDHLRISSTCPGEAGQWPAFDAGLFRGMLANLDLHRRWGIESIAEL